VSELRAFVELGFRHILDPAALDHVLFLLARAAVYQWRDWRDLLLVATAFTVGHSATLALAVTDTLTLPSTLIEFLIPVTIVVTGAENLVMVEGRRSPWRRRLRPVLAGAFGLVHGAGFANYLHAMFVDGIALPLLGFNLGIEAGQILVLVAAGVVLTALDATLERLRKPTAAPSALRLRVLAVSSLVMLVALRWAAERAPW
jgi:hypothetical protein